MIKKTVVYDDFDGNTVTEDLYFHMFTNKIVELELSHQGGLGEVLKEMIAQENMGEVYRLFKQLVMMSYGTRDPDNPTRFNPASKEAAEEFINSLAFDALFAEISKNEGAAGEFVLGILPKNMTMPVVAGSDDVTGNTGSASPFTKDAMKSFWNREIADLPPFILEERDPTQAELMALPQEDLRLAMQWKLRQDSQPKQIL